MTLFQHEDDHLFIEKDGEYLEDSRLPNPIILELSSKHKFRLEEGGVTVVIEQDSELYKLLTDYFDEKPNYKTRNSSASK